MLQLNCNFFRHSLLCNWNYFHAQQLLCGLFYALAWLISSECRCTASTNTFKCSGLKSGYIPWPKFAISLCVSNFCSMSLVSLLISSCNWIHINVHERVQLHLSQKRFFATLLCVQGPYRWRIQSARIQVSLQWHLCPHNSPARENQFCLRTRTFISVKARPNVPVTCSLWIKHRFCRELWFDLLAGVGRGFPSMITDVSCSA